MSSTQAVIRTQTTSIIGAQWLNSDFSVFQPQGPALSKAHIRENIKHTPRNGDFAPGRSVRFEVQRDIDVNTQLTLRFKASGLGAPAGAFTRWVDLLGLWSWSKLTIKSGTQLLQTVYPLELLIAANKFLDFEQRGNFLKEVGAGTPAERSASALAAKEISCPMLTLLGLNLYGDMSQSLYVRGLNDQLSVDISLVPANEVIESDVALPAEPAAGWYQDGHLDVEGFHLNNEERKRLAYCYKQTPHAITFDDQQYAAQSIVPAGTALPTTWTYDLQNINQPVTCMAFVLRWKDDLERRTAEAGGTQGRNLSNIAGWYSPGGGSNAIVESFQIRSGNNDVLATISAERLVGYQHTRDFKGESGVAIPAWSYSHDASMKNAVLGFVSFDQIERPRVVVQFRQPTLGAAHATVGSAANADIGTTSDLVIDLVGFTKMQIEQANFLLSRPFN